MIVFFDHGYKYWVLRIRFVDAGGVFLSLPDIFIFYFSFLCLHRQCSFSTIFMIIDMNIWWCGCSLWLHGDVYTAPTALKALSQSNQQSINPASYFFMKDTLIGKMGIQIYQNLC